MEEAKTNTRKKKSTEEETEVVETAEKAARKPAKKAAKKDNEEEAPSPTWYNDGRLGKITGLTLLLFSFVLGAALTSYLFTVTDDQSELLTTGASVLVNQTSEVHNALGKLGAWLSYLFFNQLFGFGAYFFVLMSFVTGFNLLVQKRVFPLLKIFLYSFVGLVWCSAAAAFANYLIVPNSVLPWGGGFGNYLTGSYGLLTTQIQIAGTAAVLVVSALITAVWVYNISFDFMLPKKKATDAALNNASLNKADVPAYKDTDENIFAKDNIGMQIETPEEEFEEPILVNKMMEMEVEVENMPEEVIEDLPFEKPTNTRKKDKGEKPELELAIEEVAEEPAAAQTGTIGTQYDPTLDLSDYKLPPLDLLDEHGSDKVKYDPEELERNKNQIIATLNNYQIEISKIKATIGPTVTLYEIVPAPGVRISKIKNLEDDIALSLAALGIRIIAPIPGKGTIGIEVPNASKEVVSMRSLLASDKFQNTTADLPICLGKSISNEIMVADLAKMPHLLMAGATGQGKSVGINAILVSLLYKKHPSQLKLILVDPKKVELSLYEALERHFLAKLPGEEDSIITDTSKVVTTLNALCMEMDQRYDLLKKAQCRNIKEYNHKFVNRQLNPNNGHKFLPYIVLVVDEFADLIMTAGKEVEMPIARLAQLARAIGIHLILATQRPSVNIITGTIKANFPARIAFKTTSKIDSRTILDMGGAEQLIGRGDMLLSMGSDMLRLQCGFVDTPEVEKIRDFIADQHGYSEAFLLPEYIDPDGVKIGDTNFMADGDRDELFEDAARVIVQNQMGSTSLIQRRLKLGYNRAGRLMDQLEEAGIVGENLGTKSREVKFKTEMELEQFLIKLRDE